MKSVIILLVLGVCNARPQAPPVAADPTHHDTSPAVTVVKSDINPNDGKGTYNYDIELSDGTKLIQMGHTEAPAAGGTDSVLVVQGSYSYVAPDGKTISVSYTADDKGFQAHGDSIPTSPPNPNAAAGAVPAAPMPAVAVAHAGVDGQVPELTQAISIASAPSEAVAAF